MEDTYFAKRMGVSRTTLHRMVSTDSNPTLDNIVNQVVKLNKNFDDFLHKDGDIEYWYARDL